MGPSWNSSVCHKPDDRGPLRKSKLSRKQLSRLSLLRIRNINGLGSTLDAEKKTSDKVPGESWCLQSFVHTCSSDVRCSRVWDWPWITNCTGAEGFPTPVCCLGPQGRWVPVSCWRSMMTFGTAAACSVDGYCRFCSAQKFPSSPPHRPSLFVSSDSQF